MTTRGRPASASWSPTTRRATTGRWARDRRRARRRARARRLGRARDGGARRRHRGSTSAAARWSPASSTATPTWSSPATGRRSSRRGCGRPLRRRRDRHHRRRHPGGVRRRAARAAARPRRRDARPGHDDRGDQERVRADRRGRGALRCGWPPRSRRDHVPRRARRPGRVRRPARRVRRPGLRPDARRLRAARPVDRRLLRAGRRTRSTATRPARCWRPAGTPGWACGCTPTSCRPDPGVRLAVELGAASADHCTHLSDADVDALAGGDDGRDAAARRGVLDPLAVPGRPPAARRRRDGRAGHRLQPGQLLHLVDGVLHRARGAGDADDAGRGAVGGDRRRRGRAAPRRRRPPRSGRAGRTSPSWTRRPTGTSPTGPASPWCTRSNCPPDRGAVGRTRRAPGAGSAR